MCSDLSHSGECVRCMFWNNLGCIHFAMGKHNLGIFYFKKALQENDHTCAQLGDGSSGQCESQRALIPLKHSPPVGSDVKSSLLAPSQRTESNVSPLYLLTIEITESKLTTASHRKGTSYFIQKLGLSNQLKYCAHPCYLIV